MFVTIYTAFTYSIASHWVWAETGWLGAYHGALSVGSRLFSDCLGYMDYAVASAACAWL